MPAPKGNKFATKLKDAKVRQEAYRQYCAHLAAGESKESFYLEHPTLSVSYKTMERYIKENPEEFPPIHKEIAEAKSLRHWEELGKKMMNVEFEKGQRAKVEPAIYQMFMRNKFGWDKNLNKESAPTSPALDGQLKILKSVDGEWKEVKN